MSMKQSSRLNSRSSARTLADYKADSISSQEPSEVQPAPRQNSAKTGTKSGGALANHKGKLAVGAAAMLGIAVFYKWREGRLAKDDPEEYARLRRLKAAVDTDKT
jgi:hypothetical protein